ncbi:MAG: polysaccharide deacetylase family protein [Leptospirales bacterium]
MRAEARALVLMYHQIEPDNPSRVGLPNPLSDPRYGLSQSRFRDQMSLLREIDLPVVGIGEFLSGTSSCGEVAPLSIIVTFDDGYSSDWERAAPILEQYGIPATFFLTSGLLGNPGMLTPPQVRELVSSPLFSLGSHGVTHRFLSHISDEECASELRESMESLRFLGGPGKYSLSVPGGRTNGRVESCAREAGYQSLLTSRAGVFRRGENLFSIPRLPVMNGWSIGDFRRYIDPGSLPFFVNRWSRSVKSAIRAGLEIPRTLTLKDVPEPGRS